MYASTFWVYWNLKRLLFRWNLKRLLLAIGNTVQAVLLQDAQRRGGV